MQLYFVLTTHESNAPFPVTRHQFRMMCNTDILQLFFEDLNQSLSPLKISYHYKGCPRRNVQDFGRVFLMLNYTDITHNTYIQS